MVVKKKVKVINKLGLHARAATKLVKLCSEFSSDIKVSKGDQIVGGKSILGVLMLAASQNVELVIQAQGEDANEAVTAIVALFNRYFDEGE